MFLGLTFVDWCVVIGAISSLILVGYEIFDHRGKREGAMSPEPARSARRKLPWLLATICWTSIAVDFADRHWWSAPLPLETPLAQSNARLDVYKWEIVTPQPLQINISATLSNNGKNTAAHLKHSGLVIVGQIIDQQTIDGYFFALTERVQLDNSKILSEINVGENDVSFVIQPVTLPISDAIATAISNGSDSVFALNITQYQDYTIGDRHIYGEQCVYLNKGVLHQCEGGHNRTYIAN